MRGRGRDGRERRGTYGMTTKTMMSCARPRKGWEDLGAVPGTFSDAGFNAKF